METNNWKQVSEILVDCLEIETSERRKFLDQANVSPEIRREVESLLAFEDEAGDLMNISAGEFLQDSFKEDDAANTLVGQKIGVYQIIGELGYGGMGAVYLAERTDGKFSQRVALKLLKREMNTAAIRRRFAQEREILASLQHANIATLLDAGTTEDKIPYIAMEYVEGLPIDDYCNKHGLDLNQRLDLFREVCAAVDFAHRNLVVHRDLKPSNILVNEVGTPKLLDFGISKILSTDFEQINTATVTKMGVMTPSYASPEQLQNKSVTTATDVYSLGIILYELLSGHRPFEAKENDIKEIYKAVIELEPPLPSAVAQTFSKQFKQTDGATRESFLVENEKSQNETKADKLRHTNPQIVNLNAQNIRGDLDNIVLKALRKEPERRYSSAENFSEDIKRHLRGLPVTARPNTFSYRTGKFINRNKASVFAGMFVFLAIVGGIIATLWQARVAQAERVKAERRFSDVRRLANSYIFDVYPEVENLEGSLKAREKILTNALEYLDSLSKEAAGDLELQTELATAYEKIGDVQGALKNSSLGNYQAGLDSYEKAARLREAVLAVDPANFEAKEKLTDNYYVKARTLWLNSQTAQAEQEFEKVIKLRRELAAQNPDSVESQNSLAIALIDYGAIPLFNSQTEKAVVLYNEALKIIENLREKEPNNAVFKKSQTRLLRGLSKAKGSLGDYEGGIRGFTQAVEITKELANEFPEDFPVQRSVWLTNSMFCELYIDKNDGEKAVEMCVPTINFPKAVIEKEPENAVVTFDLAISHFNSARAYRLASNYQSAIEQGENAISVMRKLSEKMPDDLEYKRNLAIYQTEIIRSRLKLNQTDRVIADLKNVIEILTPIAEADKSTTTYLLDLSDAYRLLAQARSEKGEKAKAVEDIDKAIMFVKTLKNQNALREANKNTLTELENEKMVYAN